MIQKIGWNSIKGPISTIGWTDSIGLFLFYSLTQISFCYGWYWTLGSWRKILGFRKIFLPFLAGDALNCTIPSANTAGEPLKVFMLQDRIPIEDGTTSVTIYKLTDFVSLTLFLAVGLGSSCLTLSFPPIWNWSGLIILMGMVGTIFLLIKLQDKGIYLLVLKIVSKVLNSERVIEIQEKVKKTDEKIRQFCHNSRKEFTLSLFFNFIGWFGGVVEAYICLNLMGLPAKWNTALAIETFALFINNITFFVPARVGVVEGSRAMIFATLGLPASSGMAYGIIRRVRELIWIALGYGILIFYQTKGSDYHEVIKIPQKIFFERV